MKIIIKLFCFLCILSIGHAQPLIENDIREQVNVHLSNSALITGETLYYTANVVSAKTHEYADLSTLLYVEIINEKQESIYQSRIGLKNGKGYGDFFIPSLVPTGSYQFIAYTRWMRNFGEYFHHPIHIINPFEVYTPPVKTEKLTVAFYPEGGNIVAGVENTLVTDVRDYTGKYVAFNGRVVDQDGNVASQVASVFDGLAKFSFTPKAGEKYQFILEDMGGNFQFVNMPVAQEDQYTIHVTDRENSFMVSVPGSENESMILRVYKGPDQVYEQQLMTNSNTLISKQVMGEGVSLLGVIKDGTLVAERLVYCFPDSNVKEEEPTKTFDRRSLVTIPVKVPHNSKLSISVGRIQEYTIPNPGIEASQLLYGVKELHKYDHELLFDQRNRELIDQLMITSSWKYDPLVEREIEFLPDHRGEIISGTVDIPDSMRTKNLMISYSIIGPDYQVKMAKVNGKGKFATVIHPFEGDRVAYITSMDGLDAELITLDQSFLSEYPNLTFQPVSLDSAEVNRIVERSVRNQIENAYFEIKRDSVYSQQTYPEEFGQFEYFYVLDDFNRFPTIKDSFVEYIPTVAVRNRKGGLELKVSPKYLLPRPALESQAFLDGLPVRADEILAFSPYRIESIGVINNRYFHGPAIFDGIVSFRTKEGDLQGFTPGSQSREILYKGVSPDKEYSFPVHADSDLGEANLSSRIPDFRDQLFWNPEVQIGADDQYEIRFFTSDTRGKFEVVVEGISAEGEIFSIRDYFIVE